MNECIFCKINNNEIPSNTLLETPNIKVIMDINPNTDGHILIIPKEHYPALHLTPTTVISEMFELYKYLVPILEETLNCDGITIYENYGLLQEVEHTHLHILPTYKKMHGIKFLQQGDQAKIKEIHDKLQAAIQ